MSGHENLSRRPRGAHKRIHLLVAWCMLAHLQGAVASEGATLRVPSEVATIQQALDEAEAGDRVVIEPGLYPLPAFPGGLSLQQRAITIESEQGPEVTEIIGRLDLRSIGEGTVVVRGLTIRDSGTFGGITVQFASALIENNILRGHQWAAISVGSSTGTVIRNNRIYDSGLGIEVSRCTDCRVVANLVADTDHAAVFGGDDVTVLNNLFEGSPPLTGSLLEIQFLRGSVLLAHNTLVAKTSSLLSFDTSRDGQVRMVNNILVAEGTERTTIRCHNVVPTEAIFELDTNLLHAPEMPLLDDDCPVDLVIANTVIGAPLFSDPQAGDYRILPGSPAIDAAASLGIDVLVDFEGDTRPLDGNASGTPSSDLGFDEHNPSLATPTQSLTPVPSATHTPTLPPTPTATPIALGERCSGAHECGSGICAVVCCSAPCNGPNRSCNEPGSRGECVAVTPVPTPTLSASECTGDCNRDGRVNVSELVRGVGMTLRDYDAECGHYFDLDSDLSVEVHELIRAVHSSLFGCRHSGSPTPTRTPRFSYTPTKTPQPGSIQILDLLPSDIELDPLRGVIYASLREPASIAVIDPDSGDVSTLLPLDDVPGQMAISDGGEYLYVGTDGDSLVQRVSLADRVVDLTFPVGDGPSERKLRIEQIQVAPDTPRTVAISAYVDGVSPRTRGMRIYDDGIARPLSFGSSNFAYGETAQQLYATTSSFPLFSVLEAGPSGLTEKFSLYSFVSGEGRGGIPGLVYDHPILFTIRGDVLDTNTLERLAEFDFPFREAVLPDLDIDRVIFAATGSTLRIEVFRYSTREKLGEVILDASSQSPRMLRFGDDGLAVAAVRAPGGSGQMFLIRTPLLSTD